MNSRIKERLGTGLSTMFVYFVLNQKSGKSKNTHTGGGFRESYNRRL